MFGKSPPDEDEKRMIAWEIVNGRRLKTKYFEGEDEWRPDDAGQPPAAKRAGESNAIPSTSTNTSTNTDNPPDNMSFRGGRGGARGGLKGATWEHDPTIKLESAPSELFPKHPNLKPQAPLTEREKRQVKYFKETQEAIHNGPLYTHPTKRDINAPAKTFGEDQFNKQYGGRGKADADPFTGVETFSQKYDPPKRTLPDLKAVKLDKKMFPKELWGMLEGEEGEEVKKHIGRIMKKKEEMVADPKSKTSAEREKVLLEKIKTAAGEEEGEGEAEEADEEGAAEEEEDYDYEEDEGDMGGDYDAEKYFDGGEDDEEEGEGGGDDY